MGHLRRLGRPARLSGHHVVHQRSGLIGDGNCIAIGSRWPVVRVEELDQHLTPRTADFPVTTMIAEIAAPGPIGPLLFVNHIPSWRPQLELERELQTVAAVRRIDALVAGGRAHVVLAGDLDAVPEAGSIRYLRGLQSLAGTSTWWWDAWGGVHPGEPGHTFTLLENPLVWAGSDMRAEWPRRIDYVFVRCDDRGPTLEVVDCSLAFAEPVGGVWGSDHFGVFARLRAKLEGDGGAGTG